MLKLEPAAAASVVGLAAFQLWQAWDTTAPSLQEVREASPGDLNVRQRMLDANIKVGGLAVIIGVAFAVLTRDVTALVLMLVIFGALSFLHNWTLQAEPR